MAKHPISSSYSVERSGLMSSAAVFLKLDSVQVNLFERLDRNVDTPIRLKSSLEIGFQDTVGTNSGSITSAVSNSPEQSSFKKGFRECLLNDFSDYGTKSTAEIFVEGWMVKGQEQVQSWLGEVYIESQSDPVALIALLKVVMHVEPDVFFPMNRMLAMASLSHSSLDVRECAVRCYEYWERPDYYVDLASRTLEPTWLEEYKGSFIN